MTFAEQMASDVDPILAELEARAFAAGRRAEREAVVAYLRSVPAERTAANRIEAGAHLPAVPTAET